MTVLRYSDFDSGLYIKASTKGQPNGVASLDANGKVPSAQLGSGADNTKFLRGDMTWQVVEGGSDDGGTGSPVYTFKVNFNNTGDPTTVDELPTGWSSSISGNYITLTHTVSNFPKFINYLGNDTGSNVYNYRPAFASIPNSYLNSQFVIQIDAFMAAASAGSFAYVSVIF